GADLSRPLFESELKQQRHQQQGRSNKKDAEPEKELAKILRLIRGLERLLAHRFEPEPEVLRAEICQHIPINRLATPAGEDAGRYLITDGGQRAESVCPHGLTGGQCDEGLGCAAILFAVSFDSVRDELFQLI